VRPDYALSAPVPDCVYRNAACSCHLRDGQQSAFPEPVEPALQSIGLSTCSIFDRYNIVDEGDIGNAAEKLQQYFKQRKAARAAKLKRVK